MMSTNQLDSYSGAQMVSFDFNSGQVGDLIMDGIGRGVIFVNNDGVLTSINRYALSLLQAKKENVIGKRVDMLPLRTPIYRVLSEQRSDIPLAMAFGKRVVAVLSKEVKSAEGITIGELTELWDITDERREKRQWEEFVVMMTHDLKSPLTVIMGYIQGIRLGMYGEIGSRIEGLLEKVEQSGSSLYSMIEEILDSCRLELGLKKLNRQPCNISRLLEDCCRDNLRVAQEQGLDLVFIDKAEAPELMADSKQLARVFSNLISNAIKFTPSQGQVLIVSWNLEESVHVSVSDTGIGIPPEDLSRIFFKYYRSAGATGYKGSGLGLAISKAIVEAHGGIISVESTPGAGSSFIVAIPLKASEEFEVEN
ncbi:MAG: PAS domain-containing sensor histidine kinase [Deltaproteobacteria bacterium]|nr:PAS domain-containing sensor histidine kinase [Deltaproteobacteria bacterium]